jgi:hypothetical protein
MKDKDQLTTGALISNVRHVEIRDGHAEGFDRGFVVENADTLTAERNTASARTRTNWYQRPLAKWSLAVLGAITAGAVVQTFFS